MKKFLNLDNSDNVYAPLYEVERGWGWVRRERR